MHSPPHDLHRQTTSMAVKAAYLSDARKVQTKRLTRATTTAERNAITYELALQNVSYAGGPGRGQTRTYQWMMNDHCWKTQLTRNVCQAAGRRATTARNEDVLVCRFIGLTNAPKTNNQDHFRSNVKYVSYATAKLFMLTITKFHILTFKINILREGSVPMGSRYPSPTCLPSLNR